MYNIEPTHTLPQMLSATVDRDRASPTANDDDDDDKLVHICAQTNAWGGEVFGIGRKGVEKQGRGH